MVWYSSCIPWEATGVIAVLSLPSYMMGRQTDLPSVECNLLLPLVYSKLLLPWSKGEARREYVSEAHFLLGYSRGDGSLCFWSTTIFENKSAQESQEVWYSPSITYNSRGIQLQHIQSSHSPFSSRDHQAQLGLKQTVRWEKNMDYVLEVTIMKIVM